MTTASDSHPIRSLGVVATALTLLLLLQACAVRIGDFELGEKEGALLSGAANAALIKATPIGPEEERAYGEAMAVRVCQRYGGLDEGHPEFTAYCNRIAWVLAQVCDNPSWNYRVGLLDSDDIQACAVPGGDIFVTRGLVRLLADEAELAAVIGHEMAHITEQHTLKIINNKKALQAITGAVEEAYKDAAVFAGTVDAAADEFLTKGLPVGEEYVADTIGAGYLAAAGWDPGAMRSALEKVEHHIHAHHADAAFDKTHPDFAARFTRLDAHVAKKKWQGGVRNAERFAHETVGLR